MLASSAPPPWAAGAALVAALAGVAPLLGCAAAYADVRTGQPEAESQVRFRGGGLFGVGALVCTSEPDQSAVRVEAETMVMFVNHTGRRATLRIDGQDAGTVAPNEAVPVVFLRGPVAVSLIPECRFNLNRAFGAVTVAVTPAPEVGPGGPGGRAAPESALIGDPVAAATGKVAVAPPVPATPAPARADGLTALVAAVCVVGVSAGAIRAILSQRVSHTLNA